MLDFDEMTLEDARAYCERYAAAVPVRERWLADELAARGEGAALLAGRDQLPGLWTWACDMFDSGPTSLRLLVSQPVNDPQPGVRPPWYSQERPSPYFSDGALWLIELLGAHLATLLMADEPALYWDVYRVPKRLRDFNQHRIKLFGIWPDGVELAQMVYSSVIGRVHYGNPWSEERSLEDIFVYSLTASGANR